MKLIGAEILIECLKEQGVNTVFGYPGGSILDIYDALHRDGTIKHVITSHEQGAAHAADGYARNRLRHHVLPVLRQQNAGAVMNIARASELFRADEEFFEGEARKFIEKNRASDAACR